MQYQLVSLAVFNFLFQVYMEDMYRWGLGCWRRGKWIDGEGCGVEEEDLVYYLFKRYFNTRDAWDTGVGVYVN